MFGLSNMLTYFYICAFIGFVFAMSDDPQTGVKVIKARQNTSSSRSVESFMEELQETSPVVKQANNHPEGFLSFSKKYLERIQLYRDVFDTKNKIAEQVKLILDATRDQATYTETYNAMLQASKDICWMKDCNNVVDRVTSLYHIMVEGNICIKVLCNMDVDGGKWTVIQQRKNGSVDFFRTWQEYKEGFGDLEGEFWLGNENIHKLTSSGRYELRVDLGDWEGNSWYAVYSEFKISNEHDKYRLSVKGYSGTAGDSLDYHDQGKFSTKDQDNDNDSSRSCSNVYKGGWWYKKCHYSNLNGLYKTGDGYDRVSWYHAKNKAFSMKFARMMIRRY